MRGSRVTLDISSGTDFFSTSESYDDLQSNDLLNYHLRATSPTVRRPDRCVNDTSCFPVKSNITLLQESSNY